MAESVCSPLASVAATKEVLEAFGLHTKHFLGQHFLINDAVVRKIITLADLQPEDRVLEVGPGIGTLTIALLRYAGSVVAVERDESLLLALQVQIAPWEGASGEVPKRRFQLISKDALKLSIEDLIQAIPMAPSIADDQSLVEAEPLDSVTADRRSLGEVNLLDSSITNDQPLDAANLLDPLTANEESLVEALPNKFVANLPYSVAATLVLRYFQTLPSLQSATVMVQKEVADRMKASPGTKNYGAYTVKLSMYAQVKETFSVSPGNFFPPPRVESTVIRLDRAHPLAQGSPLSEELITTACLFADAAFANRRKTLANSCHGFFASRGPKGQALDRSLSTLFEEAGIDPRRRGETLTREEFINLALAAQHFALL